MFMVILSNKSVNKQVKMVDLVVVMDILMDRSLGFNVIDDLHKSKSDSVKF